MDRNEVTQLLHEVIGELHTEQVLLDELRKTTQCSPGVFEQLVRRGNELYMLTERCRRAVVPR